MAADGNGDVSLLGSVVGTVIAFLVALGGLIQWIFSTTRRELGKEVSGLRKEVDEKVAASEKDRSRLWDEVNRQNEESHKFREWIALRMVTKDDVRLLEGRVISAIKQNKISTEQ